MNDIDPAEGFAEDWQEQPRGGGLRPEVWCLAEATSAEVKPSFNKLPQIEVKWSIKRSGKDDKGDVASGTIVDWLSSPPKGTDGMSEKAINYQKAHFGKCMASCLAPEAASQERQNAQVQRIVGGRGIQGYADALIGKQVLLKIGINDGKDKDGNIKNEKRAEDPRNNISNYIPAIPKNMKYLDGQAAMAEAAGSI